MGRRYLSEKQKKALAIKEAKIKYLKQQTSIG